MESNLLSAIALFFFITIFFIVFDVRVRKNIFYFQIQTLIVVTFAVVLAIQQKDVFILIAGIIALVSKAIIIPEALHFLQSKTDSKNDVSKEHNTMLHFAVILGLLAFSFFITKKIGVDLGQTELTVLILGFATFFLGLYIMIIKSNLVAQMLGFLTIENSISLLAIIFTPTLPLLIECALLLVIIVAVIIMLMISLNIKKMFKSLDTNKLTNLKD